MYAWVTSGMTALALVAWGQGLAPVPAEAEGDGGFFEREVRPLLLRRCGECHSEQSPEAGLTLTTADGVLRGGESGPVVDRDAPAESRLLAAVSYREKVKMPPEGKLRDVELKVLERWIEHGARWPAEAAARGDLRTSGVTDADRHHWAFQPLWEQTLPAVRQSEWPRSGFDYWVLAAQEQAGLSPAPDADRRTLLRRLHYDLTGLPPTFEEVQTFEADAGSTDDALANEANRLLASPAYGERWGRHWLDVARYADTKDGVLMFGDDRVRPYAYTYRDYVIRALNADTPYPQMIEEQLAADLLEPPVEPWRLAAMGLLTLGRMYDNNIHDVIDDQIDTVTRGFLGLTVSCARCHDHKYDPIPTADYYSLYGVFANCEVPLELPLIQPVELTPGGPEFEQQTAEKRAAAAQFLEEQFVLLSDTARQRTGDYLERVATTEADPLETAIFFFSLSPEDLRPMITGRWRAFIRERSHPQEAVFGPWHDLLALAELAVPATSDADTAAADLAVQRVLQRWAAGEAGVANPRILAALQAAPLRSRADVAQAYGKALRSAWEAAVTEATPEMQELRELMGGSASPNTFPKHQTRRYMSRAETDKYGGMLNELDRLAVQSPAAPPRAMVVRDRVDRYEPRVFVRGNAAQAGRAVPQQFLEVLSPVERTAFAGVSGRRDLARAIAAHPLAARVVVNRVWMHHMGEPLVNSPSDFGVRTAEPRQRALLDELARSFLASGGSLKALHRQIVLSRVWRQASVAKPDVQMIGEKVDPENQLWWKARRRRLEIESLRDSLLAVAGRLEHRVGGRPVEIASQPEATVRTVYGLIDRQSLPGLFRAFDFASPDVSNERRPRTVVPQQALFALNSSLMRAQAVHVAAAVASEEQAQEKVIRLYRRVLQRDPDADELLQSVAFVEQPEAGSPTVWEQLAQVLMASNEFMYLD